VDDPSPAIKKFVADYKARYGNVPDALAALGYDAMRVLADSINRAGTTEGPKLKDAIAATKDFAGVTGTISLDKDRNAVKPAVVLKLQDKKYVYVETIYPEGMTAPTAPAAPATSGTSPAAAPVLSPAKAGAATPAKAASPAVTTKKPAASPQ
ncbi:MAG TPA: ABC transporter substrate-binding protein, partial [Pyrinomonadaceae bacterium]